MEDFNEKVCLCALNRVSGNSPLAGRELLEHYGSASAAVHAPHEEWEAIMGVPCEHISQQVLDESAAELEKLAAEGKRFIGMDDDDYPTLLRECPDCPLGLYVQSGGPLPGIFEMRPCVAVVGTRDISPYGRDWCRRIVRSLADADIPPVIVSGLAFGADAIAHMCALEYGTGTVGVMATGLDKIYPWRHVPLAGQIVDSPCGALVTDYPYGTSPVALNFIRRNRIIAGLSRATIVIESKSKGGSLLTAKYAADYDREVYALPGRADDLRSQGCNSLIATKMAELILDGEDLAERLGLMSSARGRMPLRQRKMLFKDKLVRRYGETSPLVPIGLAVLDNRGASLEEISRACSRSFTDTLQGIAVLQADGLVILDLLQRCSPAF